MCAHSQGVDSGIRAARTVQAARVPEYFAERLLDDLLNADPSFLSLPSRVCRAAISNRQSETESTWCRYFLLWNDECPAHGFGGSWLLQRSPARKIRYDWPMLVAVVSKRSVVAVLNSNMS